MTTIAVVGGGIGGIVAAYVLKRNLPDCDVVLIEGSSRLGGLLGTSEQFEGRYFDIGTHIPAQTLIDELDLFLFEHIKNNPDWNQISRIRGGNYFRGKLNERHHNIDVGDDVSDFVDGVDLPNQNDIVSDYLFRFGKQLTEHIFYPTINQFLPLDASEVESEVQRYFALDRLSNYAGRKREQLASDPLSTTRINLTGKRIPMAFYPKHGKGVSSWIDTLTEKLIRLGVTVRVGNKIKSISSENDEISALTFYSGEMVRCNKVVWTAPIETLACLVAPSRFAGLQRKYTRTSIKLFNLVVNAPYLSSCHYINCFDASLSPYRITLYENIEGRTDDVSGYRCTVEVIGDKSLDTQLTDGQILRELIEMGIFPEDAEILFSNATGVMNGFPVRLIGAYNEAKELTDNLLNSLTNLILTGSALPGVFFMNDVMIKTFNLLNQQCKSGELIRDPA